MEKIIVNDWNIEEEINTKEDVIGLLDAALEENDIDFLLKIIGNIARSKGMSQIAKELDLNRESLYKSLSQDGNPSFNTVAKVLDYLGFQLSVKQKVTAW